jgi:hypothetical protein
LLALPAAATTQYLSYGYTVQPADVCHGARHTLNYIDVYPPYSSGAVGEVAETSVDKHSPGKEKFSYNDVDSDRDRGQRSDLTASRT